MIFFIRKQFAKNLKGQVTLPKQLKRLSNNYLIQRKVQEVKAQFRNMHNRSLSQTLSPEYKPEKISGNKIDMNKIQKMMRKNYKEIINNKRDQAFAQLKKYDKQFIAAQSRQALQNKMNHSEWKLFKQQSYEIKEKIRLLEAEKLNPTNYLPQNYSQRTLRFQKNEESNKTLGLLKIQRLLNQSKNNSQLAQLLQNGLTDITKPLPQWTSALQQPLTAKQVELLSKKQDYKNWLFRQSKDQLAYRVQGRLQFHHFSEQQFKKYLWLDVKHPGQLIHIFQSNQMSTQRIAQSYIRLAFFKQSLQQATRMRSTALYRNMLRLIFKNADQLSDRQFVQIINALGKQHSQDQGLQFKPLMTKILKVTQESLLKRDHLTGSELGMAIVGLIKLPIQKKLQLQKTLLKLLQERIQNLDLYFYENIGLFLSGADPSLAPSNLLSKVLIKLLDTKEEWLYQTYTSFIKMLNALQLYQPGAIREMKKKIENRLSESSKLLDKFPNAVKLQAVSLLIASQLQSVQLQNSIKSSIYHGLKKDSLVKQPIQLCQLGCGLAQLELKRALHLTDFSKFSLAILTNYFVYLPNSAKYLPFNMIVQTMSDYKQKVTSIWLSQFSARLSILQYDNEHFVDQVSEQALTSLKKASVSKRFQILSNLMQTFSGSRRLPAYVSSVLHQLVITIDMIKFQSILNYHQIVWILSSILRFYRHLPFQLRTLKTILQNKKERLSTLQNLLFLYQISTPYEKKQLQVRVEELTSKQTDPAVLALSLVIQGKLEDKRLQDALNYLVEIIDKKQPSRGQIYSFTHTLGQIQNQLVGSKVLGIFVYDQNNLVVVSSWDTLLRIQSQKQTKYVLDFLWYKLQRQLVNNRKVIKVFAPEWGQQQKVSWN